MCSESGPRTTSDQAPLRSPRSGRRSSDALTLAATLAVAFTVLVLTMPEFIYTGDPMAIRASTIRWLETGRLDVPGEYAESFGDKGQYFFENPRTGKWYPKFGILNTFLYAPPLFLERLTAGPLGFDDGLDSVLWQRRCWWLNVYNITLSLILAVYLYRTARHVAAPPGVAMTYVLLVFFGTFLWTYLRAQTTELFQVLFFSAAQFHVVRLCPKPGQAGTDTRVSFHIAMAATFVGLLMLVKIAYVVLLPPALFVVCAAGYHAAHWHGGRPGHRLVLYAVLPLLTASVLLLAGNWYRFGSPWATGYGQWTAERALFTSQPAEGLVGFIIDPQKSVFLYFPVLLLAVFGMRSFWRQWPLPFAFACLSFLFMYLLCSWFVNWRGDWCLGPRYLLFVLPALGLPLTVLFRPEARCPGFVRLFSGGILVASLLTVNSPMSIHGESFFSAFEAQIRFPKSVREEIRPYFRRPLWDIHRQLRRWRMGVSAFPPLEQVRGWLTVADQQQIEDSLRKIPWGNYYWLHRRKAPNSLVGIETASEARQDEGGGEADPKTYGITWRTVGRR